MRAARSWARWAPSRLAHLHQRGQRGLQRLLHGRPEIFRLDQFVVGLENARRADELIERDRAGEFQFPRELAEFVRVGFGERDVQVHARGRLAVAGVDRDARREPPARNLLVDRLADARFEHFQFAREIHRNLGLLAVHRTEFDRDIESVPGAIAAPITRHRLHRGGICGNRPPQAMKFSTPVQSSDRAKGKRHRRRSFGRAGAASLFQGSGRKNYRPVRRNFPEASGSNVGTDSVATGRSSNDSSRWPTSRRLPAANPPDSGTQRRRQSPVSFWRS